MDVWYNGKYAMTFYAYGNDLNPIGNKIAHTWKDWNLVPTARPFFVPPKKKTSTIDLKAVNGTVDVSDRLTGYPLYENREGSWTFYITEYSEHPMVQDNNGDVITDHDGDPILATILTSFTKQYTNILNHIHGRNVAIVLDEDPEYYYKGSVQISQWVSANDGSLSGLTIEYKVFPYKIKIERTEVELVPEGGISALQPSPPVSIKTGKMPVVPYLLYPISGTGTPYVNVKFTNPDIFDDYKVAARIEAPYNKYVKAYTNAESGHAVVLSNTYGDNICTVSISASMSIQSLKLIFREGEL